jgi:hypothetical protein
LNSIIATPTGEQYDYVLSASTLQTVLDGKHIKRYDISPFIELCISIVIGLILVILTRFTPYWVVGLNMLVLYVASIFGTLYLFNNYLLLADASWIVITITLVGLHSIFNRFVLEFQLKQQIKKTI